MNSGRSRFPTHKGKTNIRILQTMTPCLSHQNQNLGSLCLCDLWDPWHNSTNLSCRGSGWSHPVRDVRREDDGRAGGARGVDLYIFKACRNPIKDPLASPELWSIFLVNQKDMDRI